MRRYDGSGNQLQRGSGAKHHQGPQGQYEHGQEDHQHDDIRVHATPESTSIKGVSNEVHHANDGHEDHNHISHGVFEHSALRSILLLIALSFHSVFEGLSIGLSEDKDQLISMFIAVLVHKAVMAFSLGLNIAQSNLSKRSFIFSNIIFSIASPLGLGIGIFVTDLPNTLPRSIASGVLQGICGGTFLYITFFEVLPHEMNVPSNRLWKVLFIILGYGSICGLLFVSGH
jgi:zinc transporter 1/2/3